MTVLDVEFVRAQFPAFSEPSLQGQAFFENAGGSYTCQQVIDRLHRFYTQRKVQPYGVYAASKAGGDEMDEARSRLAALLNIEEDELSFGPSTSSNTYVLAHAFSETLDKGDVVIVTDQDHEANSGAWRRMEARGMEIREWHVNAESGQLELETLAEILDERVKLVCFPHCSNIIGQENPVAEIAAMVHAVGGVTCVDGVSMVPHGFPDVAALNADIYLFSSYKTYGPHQGIMVVRRALADRLANQAHFFNAGSRVKRLTPAGPDHAQIAASAGMADYVDALYDHHFSEKATPANRARAVTALQRAHENKVLAPLLDFLRDRNDARILGGTTTTNAAGAPNGRVPTVALNTAKAPAQIVGKLADQGIMAGAGDFYALRTIGAMGCDAAAGVLRLSFVHYTDEGEVGKLINALDASL
ncbi:aminotransferase class V-fold PLP-dependent enzyme [Alphaproteobacteria bacterium]|jgi:selenocysteine lyase/cysteine desulfurase|nr:aminotransferase class V-fold PLP-dependent enzyme [Alphaproteobacteria bacterium]